MAIKKKEFKFEDIKSKFSSKTKYKPEAFYNCGEAFMEACGLPGPVMGGISMLLGHSNSAKTTAMILAAADAQRRGHLPILIITEKKWSWSHAVELGLQAEKNEDGEWEGHFIFNDSFDYIEQTTDFINDILDAQEKGDIPYNLLFCWDSVGSIPCKMTYEGRGGKMANASVLADTIGMGIHSRITKSKKDDYPYYNTLIIVNQPWVDVDMSSPMSQPEIRSKGGEAIWLASSLVFLFGKQKKAGINHIDATKNGRKISFAIRTRISIIKNHVNGLGFKDGKIIAVHNGYISDTKEAMDKYKKEFAEYWAVKMGGNDFTLEESKDLDFEE
jgi:hypothetical protein